MINEEKYTCPCGKKKVRTEEERKALVNRLKRIEGQVRGVLGMVEDDAYCVDILVQVSAISSALGAFSRELLSHHINECVIEDIKNGKTQTAEELVSVVSRFIK